MMTRYKHLRGRHNQLEHAWNRGLGAATAAVGAARTRAQSLMNSIRGAAGGALASMSTRAQSLIGQAQGIADAIQSKTGGLIGRVNALLQRTRGGSRGSESQVQGDTGANQSTLERVIGRINALRNRKVSPIPETTPQPSEPKLPDGYDTTRFDTPSKNAPMPIKKEMIQPGGEVFDEMMELYANADFVDLNDANNDMLAIAIASNSQHYPSSRWHVSYLDRINNYLPRLIESLQSLGINIEDESPIKQNQMWNTFQQERYKSVGAEVINDDNPYIVKVKNDYMKYGMSEEQAIEGMQRARKTVNAYEASKRMDYNQLNDLVVAQQQYVQNLIKNAKDSLELVRQEVANNPGDKEKVRTLENAEMYLRSLESEIQQQSRRFTESGEVIPLSAPVLMQSLPVTRVLSMLYNQYGYDAKPEVASWNELSSDNVYSLNGTPLMLYRSIRGASETGFASATSSVSDLTASQIYDATLNSEKAHVGSGVDGMGMYWKSRGNNPEQSPEEGDGAALQYGREKYGDHTFAGVIKQNARLYDMPVGDPGTLGTYGSTMNASLRDEFISRFGDVFGKSLPDVGVMMAMLGWEGYLARSDEKGGFNWVTLNRAAIIFSQEMITPDTPQDIIDKAFRTGRI